MLTDSFWKDEISSQFKLTKLGRDNEIVFSRGVLCFGIFCWCADVCILSTAIGGCAAAGWKLASPVGLDLIFSRQYISAWGAGCEWDDVFDGAFVFDDWSGARFLKTRLFLKHLRRAFLRRCIRDGLVDDAIPLPFQILNEWLQKCTWRWLKMVSM